MKTRWEMERRARARQKDTGRQKTREELLEGTPTEQELAPCVPYL